MVKTIFEEMGGTYTKVGDYCLPKLLSAKKGEQPIGLWGQRHSHYLKQNHRVLYMNLLTSGRLNSYLAGINEQAEDMFLWLVNQMAEREGMIEQLKTDNQMKWVAQINNIRSRAAEIVNHNINFN